MAYVDGFVKNGTEVGLRAKRSIATDRMGPWKEQQVTLVWEGSAEGKPVAFTPDEAEILFERGLMANGYRCEDGSFSMRSFYLDCRTFPYAIVCGIMAPSTKAKMRLEIFEYAKKMGYVTDVMTPVEMASGTKTLIFNEEDGTYSILYTWNEGIMKNVSEAMRTSFTKMFFDSQTQCITPIEFKSDGFLMPGLTEAQAFSSTNIYVFRGYDIQLFFLSEEYDKELLLRAIMKIDNLGRHDILGRGEFEHETGKIEIPIGRQNSLVFNAFEKCQMHCGRLYRSSEHNIDYSYYIDVPYSEEARLLMMDTAKLLKRELGGSVRELFYPFGKYVNVWCASSESQDVFAEIEREFVCLDYALMLLEMEENFNWHQFYFSIMDLLESDSTKRFKEVYHKYKISLYYAKENRD